MNVEEATFVRRVQPSETLEELVDEAKAMTWVHEAEHALLELSTRERILVRGGRDGIRFRLRGAGCEEPGGDSENDDACSGSETRTRRNMRIQYCPLTTCEAP